MGFEQNSQVELVAIPTSAFGFFFDGVEVAVGIARSASAAIDRYATYKNDLLSILIMVFSMEQSLERAPLFLTRKAVDIKLCL